MKSFVVRCLFLFCFVYSFSYTQAQKKFELADMAKLVSVSDPQISADGKSIIIVVSRPDYAQKRFNAELVLVDVATGSQRVLTQNRVT
jgi:hypothetical protein